MNSSALTVAPLTEATWPAFAALVEAHRGILGGCWCLGFHAERNAKGSCEGRREMKLEKVRRGAAGASFDGILLQERSPEAGLTGPVTNIYDGTGRGLTEAPHLFWRRGTVN